MNDSAIKKMREFNRYYTVWLDVMNKGYLETGRAWPESRVLFELYLCAGISATDLCRHLNMDKSYVSRILGKFEKQGLLTREPVPGGKGLKKIRLTQAGRREAEQIDQRGNQQLRDKLAPLDDETCGRLCEAMAFIEKTLRCHDKER
ncbi:MarR family transcriptional regulator [Anaerofilum sp. BX8]|uniref:MarR family transcriptional regulator n=1 Tax=Anaerofilum hominis TaxID=2763016 RepID=A0A923L1Y6_9FIRM|nr:MarR family transcriptional regulator [Anaerofilum hominis]MBC5582356.1 MarR family transcriptional regulator [Anaerofilum hominis]